MKKSSKEIFAMQADVCRALGNPLRIEIIDILQDGEMGFSDLLEKTGGLKSNLSQHLSVLAKKGIVKSRREGQAVFFSLTSKKVAKACGLMREVLIDNLNKKLALVKNK